MTSLGHRVTLVTTAGEACARARRKERQEVRVLITPRFASPGVHDGGWAPVDVLYRSGWLLGRRFDIVHAFGHRPNVALPWMLKRLLPRGARFFADWDDWWTRGGIITPRRRWKLLDTLEAVLLEERVPRKASGLTVASTCLFERAAGLGVPRDRILLLPQGADVEAIRPEDREACRAALGLPREAPVIDFVGYAVWDVRILLDAFERVREKFPSALLQIIGYDKDGQLPRLVAASPHREAVLERGQVPFEKLSLYLGAGDVQALPLADRLDNRARWPIKLGDYLASGRPVVVQAVGDGARVVGENGLGVVTGPTAEAFAGGVIELLSQPQRAIEMGRKAREYAEREMRWEARAQALADFYARSILSATNEYE